MKILLTGDIHVHAHRSDNRRIEDGLECLEWIYKTAEKEEVEYVIIAGDLFHNRFLLNSYTYAKVCRIIQKSSIHTILLLGNHDMVYEDNWSIHSLVAMSPACMVVDEPKTLFFGTTQIDFLPYTPTPSKFLGTFNPKSEILISHLAVADAVLNAKYDVKSVEDDSRDKEIISASAFEGWKKVYLGHYHYAQKVTKTVEYIGSPMQLSFGEAEQEKHVIILDLETGKQKYVENDISPRFHIVEHVKQIDKINVQNAYIQMRTDGDVAAKFDLRSKLESAGVRELEFAPVKQDLESQTTQALFDVSQVINDKSQLVESFVDSIEIPDGMNKDLLKKIGKSIVTGT